MESEGRAAHSMAASAPGFALIALYTYKSCLKYYEGSPTSWEYLNHDMARMFT